MQKDTISKFETGGIFFSIFLMMTLGSGYAYLCFNAPENKELGIASGFLLACVLFYHVSRVFSIFKYKNTVTRLEYLLNYPLGIGLWSGMFALLALFIVEFSSVESKVIWVTSLALLSFFNLFLTVKLAKKM